MALTRNSIITPQTPQADWSLTILPADTTTKKTLGAALANGGIVKGLNIATDDTAARDVQIWRVNADGTTKLLLGQVAVPALSGFSSTVPPVSALTLTNIPASVLDPSGNRYLQLGPNETIQFNMVATLTAAKSLYVTALEVTAF